MVLNLEGKKQRALSSLRSHRDRTYLCLRISPKYRAPTALPSPALLFGTLYHAAATNAKGLFHCFTIKLYPQVEANGFGGDSRSRTLQPWSQRSNPKLRHAAKFLDQKEQGKRQNVVCLRNALPTELLPPGKPFDWGEGRTRTRDPFVIIDVTRFYGTCSFKTDNIYCDGTLPAGEACSDPCISILEKASTSKNQSLPLE